MTQIDTAGTEARVPASGKPWIVARASQLPSKEQRLPTGDLHAPLHSPVSSDAVPGPPPMPIIEPPVRPVRVATPGRWIAAGIAFACLTVLVIAAYLAPDPAGVGTTMRMGLAPCGFKQTTGLPCAGCGLTTAFNHGVRWQWLKAFWVQPMGALLTLGTAFTFWGALYVAVTAKPLHRLIGRAFAGRGVTIVIGVVGFGIASWGFKIALTLLGIDGTNW